MNRYQRVGMAIGLFVLLVGCGASVSRNASYPVSAPHYTLHPALGVEPASVEANCNFWIDDLLPADGFDAVGTLSQDHGAQIADKKVFRQLVRDAVCSVGGTHVILDERDDYRHAIVLRKRPGAFDPFDVAD